MKSDIEKAVELKNRHIAKFQDSKERSMAIMSSGRDAVMIMCELIGADSRQGIPLSEKDIPEIKNRIKEWRKFFFYEIYGTDPDDEVKQHLKKTLPPNTILGF